MTATATARRAFEPIQIGPLRLRNRILKAATFEGMCPDGLPSAELTRFHERTARGGTALTTVAYAAVSADGRSYNTQLWMRPEAIPGLRSLTDAVHEVGGAAALQLGHCGGFSHPRVIGQRPVAPSARFVMYNLTFSRAMAQADFRRIREDFVRSARMAADAGFDAIELHLGHGYLLSQMLCPSTNSRRDGWGGSLTNRLRFPLDVVSSVLREVGDRLAVFVKMNLEDGFSGGLQLQEAVIVAHRLEQVGAHALVLSGGFVLRTPLYMLRGEVPFKEMAEVQDRWITRIGLILFGRLFVQRYPFEPGFFLEPGKAVRAAVSLPLVLLGGIQSVATIDRAMAAGFDAVGMGRALLYDPDLVHKLEAEETHASDCEPCNLCIPEMDRGGVRCARPEAPGFNLA